MIQTTAPAPTETAPRPFVMSRSFPVSGEVMWKAWTDREQLMQWFGPKGFTMTTAKMDFRPGGSFHYGLRSADGSEIWGKFAYREIIAPERIVLVNSFSDASGGTTRHPFSATWPLLMHSTFSFEPVDGGTAARIEWTPLNPTAEERATFDGAHDGMRQGWGGTFEQLEAYLALR